MRDTKPMWTKHAPGFVLLWVLLIAPSLALATPVLQTGIASGSTYVLDSTQTITVGGIILGSDKESAFTSNPSFTLALAGQYKNSDVVSLGGTYNGVEIELQSPIPSAPPYTQNVPYTATWGDSDIAPQLGFLGNTKGAVLMVSVAEGESVGGLSFSPLSGVPPPTFITSRTGGSSSGFANNHFPTGSSTKFDYFYYDLGSAFSNLSNAVPNFQDAGDSLKYGEVRKYDVSVSGLSYAHFDIMAIAVEEEIEWDAVYQCFRKKKNKILVSTLELEADVYNNPGSHDASYYNHTNNTPVPEPGSMVLLGTGLVGLAGWGRKKFRK